MLTVLEATSTFEEFCSEVQPRLRHAFAARYGYSDGADATAEALAYAWEHWADLREIANPVGYLYRVGQSRTKRIRRATPLLVDTSTHELPDIEPALPQALASLSESQRVAVTLVIGFGWKLREVAELTEVSVSTVQNHVERGMKKLRTRIGGST